MNARQKLSRFFERWSVRPIWGRGKRLSGKALACAVLAIGVSIAAGLAVLAEDAGPAAPVLQAYQVPENLAEVAAQWQSQYAKEPGVRIAVDSRTSQILVLAPVEVHEQLAQLLKNQAPKTEAKPLGGIAAPPSGLPAPAEIPQLKDFGAAHGSPGEGTAVSREVHLKNIDGKQLETGLTELCGRPLPKATSDAPNATLYVFDANTAGRKLTIEVDHRKGDVTVVGPPAIAEVWVRIIEALDSPPSTPNESTKLVALRRADRGSVRKAMDALLAANGANPMSPGDAAASSLRTAAKSGTADGDNDRSQQALKAALTAKVFQTRNANTAVAQAQPGEQPNPPNANQPNANQPNANQPNANQPGGEQPGAVQPPMTGAIGTGLGIEGLIGPVRIEYLGEDIMIIQGFPKDVERVIELIKRIDEISAQTTPAIEIYPLKNVAGDALATLVRQINDQLSNRNGTVSITPLGTPNALLLIGRPDAVTATKKLIEQLDQPVEPATQMQTFRLQHTSAALAQDTIQTFFANRAGLGPKVSVTIDHRSNSLFVTAAPRDLQQVESLVKEIDIQKVPGGPENVIRLFPLKNTMATNIAPILQDAVNGQVLSGNRRAGGTQQGGQGGQGAAPGQSGLPGAGGGAGAGAVLPGTPAGGNQAPAKSSMLRFETFDAQGRKVYQSGILTDVHVSADPGSNSLVITAPADSMDLLAALVNQLDQSPAAEAQIKVFTIVNGDAANLATLLQNLFGQSQTNANRNQQGGGAGGFPGLFAAAAATGAGGEGESTLIPLRLSVDQRTNSIVVSGASGDLNVVEAILLRLDASDVQPRKNAVYRLKNAPATDVATAINQFLTGQRQIQTLQPGVATSAFEQIESEVIVVPEPVNNSLIISATPRYFDEIKNIVEQLDARPPMVMVQVLIAEVTLNNTDEFGIELGLQDGLLFDRSLLSSLVTTTSTTTLLNGTTVNNTNVLAANNTPGFNFNNQPLGNSASTQALAGARNVGGQGLSDFGVGRTNSTLGFGGLVLSASSENVSALLRALRECRRTDVLSRPQIMTLDNQAAFIQVGQRVPQITGVNTTTIGQTNTVTTVNTGIILGVTPRISPDGLVVMEIDAERSEVGPDAEGIPISISTSGTVIRSPRIDVTVAQTTVSALSGQTVVLGGLITKSRAEIHRRVPLLSDIPILGNLFRYDNVTGERRELLIIMTPRIVRNEQDSERIKQMEAARMSWCLADVVKVHGESGLRGRSDEWTDAETNTVYPDANPIAPEMLPTPAKSAVKPDVSLRSKSTPPLDAIGRRSAGQPPLLPELAPATANPNAGVLVPTPAAPPQAPATATQIPASPAPFDRGRTAPNAQGANDSGGPNLFPDSARRAPQPLRPAVEIPQIVEPTHFEMPDGQ